MRGICIAKENNWRGLVIEISAPTNEFERASKGGRCYLRNTEGDPEIDEPSSMLLDVANRLQSVFVGVGTPLVGATIDWIDESGDGRVRRRCGYRYDWDGVGVSILSHPEGLCRMCFFESRWQ